jgi:hypothetical protein
MRSIGSCRPRARVMAATGLGCALVLASPGQLVHAADPAPRSRVADLAERLKVGLRVQAPDDVAFCDAVARLVAEGRLPLQVVDGTYTWSLQRGRKYPFPAFEHVIKIKAARLGVAL